MGRLKPMTCKVFELNNTYSPVVILLRMIDSDVTINWTVKSASDHLYYLTVALSEKTKQNKTKQNTLIKGPNQVVNIILQT